MWVSLSIETFWASPKPALNEVRSCVCNNEGFSPVLLMGWVEDPGLGSPSCLLSQGLDAGKMGQAGPCFLSVPRVLLTCGYHTSIHSVIHNVSGHFLCPPTCARLWEGLVRGSARPPPPTCISNRHRNDHKTKM